MSSTGAKRKSDRARIAVLLSGSGRTLRNLLLRIDEEDLHADVVRVISTRRNVAGNRVATGAGIPVSVAARRDHTSTESFSDAVIDLLDGVKPDLVVCAGFLSKLIVPERYMGSIVNIHPSLLPLFGGRGFYGDRVHQAVLDSGMKVSGCTVHFVDNAYDAGPIIAQRCVPVFPDDTLDSLAARVFDAECDLYPKVIGGIVDGRIALKGDRAWVDRALAGDLCSS